ncbi:MAG: hypothetical protein EOP49_30530 [Sphingobacteriales bacterium]|nr:MAG: hypothetical protein EOP49_30530 [Sphingobacteriales bacterium]
MKKSLFLLLLTLSTACAMAQDKIYTKLQPNPIEGEVVEISVNEVKYKPVDRPLPIITIDKQDVIKIVYRNGQVNQISDPLVDFTMYNGQKKWNLKLNLLSPLNGHTQLFLEHAQKPGRSVEYELNLIGLGRNQPVETGYFGDELKMNAVGAGIGIGLKLLRLPDYVNGQTRLRHIMQGSYIKPAISVSAYGRDFVGVDQLGQRVSERKTVLAVNPNLTLGKQWILDNTISVDIFGLVGFGLDNVQKHQKDLYNEFNGSLNIINFNSHNAFGYRRFSNDNIGLTLGLGVKVGFLFNTKEKKKK